MKNKLILKTCAASLLAFSLSLTSVSPSKAHHYIPTYEECEAMGNKITICHATSSETNPYVEITIACEAMYGNGNAGHFSENGTTLAGHEDDYVLHEGGSCNIPTEAVPTPTPTESLIPTPTPMSKNDPQPTGQPPAAPTSQSEGNKSEGRQSSLANDNLQCTTSYFDAVMDVKDNGNPVRDILVRFAYNGASREARTNENGRAKVAFDQNGNGSLTATAEGYPSQSMYITVPQCGPVALDPDRNRGGSILGTSTDSTKNTKQGQVLGASTLADTGSGPLYSMATVFAAGLLMTLSALYGYNQDKKTQA